MNVEIAIENSIISAVIFFRQKINKSRETWSYLKEEAGPTDVYTIARHAILSVYLWVISIPFLEGYGQTVVTTTTLIVTILVTLFFFQISKSKGFLFAVLSLVFKEKEIIKLAFLFVFEPFLFAVEAKDYCTKRGKKVLPYLLGLASILLASVLWGWFVNLFGEEIKKIFPTLLEWLWQRAGILIIFYVRA